MPTWSTALAIAVPSAAAGVLLQSRLSRFGYRRDDEHSLPRRRTWWVAPATVVVSVVLGLSVSRFDSAAVVATFVLAGWVMVALAFIDLDVHRLPNRIQLPSYPVLAALLVGCSAATADWSALLRALICCAALWVFYFVLALLPSGFGFGDVKLAGLLGMLLGWISTSSVVTATLATFVVGGLVAAAIMVVRRADRRSEFAYGPSMLVGAVIAVVLARSAS